MIDLNYQGCSQIFTDRSLNHATGVGGFGIHIPIHNVNVSSQIYDNLSICTIELIAIYQGITLGVKRNLFKMLIITNFLSVIRRYPNPPNDTLTASIKMLIHGPKNNYIIQFRWVPSHLGIRGIEVSITLAKIGRDQHIPYKHKVDDLGFFPWNTNQIQKHFLRQWKYIGSFLSVGPTNFSLNTLISSFIYKSTS